VNDICYLLAPRLKLNSWPLVQIAGPVKDSDITVALKSLRNQPVAKTIETIAKTLSTFDWRTSAAEELSENDRLLKLGLRGGSGYKELRRQLIDHLAEAPGDVGRVAQNFRKGIV
jgi:hypothetical protein